MRLYNTVSGLLEGCCYHKVDEDLRVLAEEGGLLDRMQERIAREIEASQVLMRDAVWEAMECEAIGSGTPGQEGRELIRIRNNINVNIVN